jgi:hypothetical protein
MLPNGYIFQTFKNLPLEPRVSHPAALLAPSSSLFLFLLLPHAGQSFPPPFFFLQAFPSFLFLQAFPSFFLFSFFRHFCKLWPRTLLSFSSSSVLWALRNTQIEEISSKKRLWQALRAFFFFKLGLQGNLLQLYVLCF